MENNDVFAFPGDSSRRRKRHFVSQQPCKASGQLTAVSQAQAADTTWQTRPFTGPPAQEETRPAETDGSTQALGQGKPVRAIPQQPGDGRGRRAVAVGNPPRVMAGPSSPLWQRCS